MKKIRLSFEGKIALFIGSITPIILVIFGFVRTLDDIHQYIIDKDWLSNLMIILTYLGLFYLSKSFFENCYEEKS